MKNFKNYTLVEYTKVLSERQPVPGGGSAAAMTAALGVSLLAMVANYSLGRGQSISNERRLLAILKFSENLRDEFLCLVDEDAQAYLGIVKARKGSEKDKAIAKKAARKISRKTCQMCLKAINLTPELVLYGNQYLISDVSVGIEHLLASFNSACILLKA